MAKKKPNDNLPLFKKEVPKMPEGYYSGDKPNPNLRAFVEQHIKERPYDSENDDYDVPIMMAELVDWLNQKKEVHPVLVSGISQFQAVHIHPFLDGNGRTSRLLSTLCLYRSGYDFKRLFTISEYYDRVRPAFYRAIQSVREHGMDMTGWLEYFVEGLTTQLAVVRERGEQAIRRDVLVKEHRLSDRQAKALAHILEHGSLTIQDFEGFMPRCQPSVSATRPESDGGPRIDRHRG